MSPVPNDNPITPLIRRSGKSSSSIIELNSDVENIITPTIPDYYCSTIMLHDGYRTTDFHIYPKTSNLHDGCRATDADCGTSRPFIPPRGNKAKTRCVVPRAAPWSAATRKLRGTKDRGAAARNAARCRTGRHHETRQHRELRPFGRTRGTMGRGNIQVRGTMERGSTRVRGTMGRGNTEN